MVKSRLTKADHAREWIAREIRIGNFARGTTLPPEQELADRFGISYMTLRKAVGALVEEGLSALGFEPRKIEGYQSAMWIVLDYYDVIVHIFYEKTREFYALERLWADAPKVALELKD